jgi:hypothetical protein
MWGLVVLGVFEKKIGGRVQGLCTLGFRIWEKVYWGQFVSLGGGGQTICPPAKTS